MRVRPYPHQLLVVGKQTAAGALAGPFHQLAAVIAGLGLEVQLIEFDLDERQAYGNDILVLRGQEFGEGAVILSLEHNEKIILLERFNRQFHPALSKLGKPNLHTNHITKV